MESILTSIKKLLGIAEDYTQFDQDVIMHINTVLMTLTQLGVGPDEGFEIEDDSETWDEFVEDEKGIKAIRTFVYLKVRLLFDPPLSSTLIESIERQAGELEWRIRERAEELKNSVNTLTTE